MMNPCPKRASISATLVFADLRQITNGIAEARQYSIQADDVQLDRCFLLSWYESTSLARPIARSTLRTLTWKSTARQPRTSAPRAPWSLASRLCSLRPSPGFTSSTVATRGNISAMVADFSSALPRTSTTNDAPETSRKNSKRLLAASHGVRVGGGVLR
jgi:hypothetical protein